MEWKKSLVGGVMTVGMMVLQTAAADSAPNVTCSMPTVTAGGTTDGVISADTPSSDGTRLFANNTVFRIQVVTDTRGDDRVSWAIKDYAGDTRVTGAFAVPAGPHTSVLSCTGTASGYFALSATLQEAKADLPSAGTRPKGIATFGILPYVGSVLSPAQFTSQDQHRFGMQGGSDKPKLLTALGVTQTLDSRALAAMEPGKRNTWMPSPSDLAPLYQDGSIARLVRLDGIPGWASPTGSFEYKGYAPTDLTYYQSFMARVGIDSEAIRQAHFPNMQHNYYQVTWEPWWEGSPASFVAMYEAVYKGLHSTDPHAVVMGVTSPDPGMCGTWCTGAQLKKYGALGLGNYIDGVTTHSYYVNHVSASSPPEEPEDGSLSEGALPLDRQLRDLRAQMQSIKPNMRLWSTELGVAYDPDIAYGSEKISANQLYAQAVVATRAHLIVLGEGAQVTYFFYGSDYPPEKWTGHSDLVGFGMFFDLAHPEGDIRAKVLSPKPQALAFAALTRIMDGTETLGRLNALPAGVHGYAFRRLNYGPVITALWAHDRANWPSKQLGGLYSAGAGTDYTLTVDTPDQSGEVSVFDMMGNRTRMTYTNGVVHLTLSEVPIYVVSGNAAVAKANVTAPVGYTGQ